MDKRIPFAAVAIIVIAAIAFSLVTQVPIGSITLNVTAYPQPASPGYATIKVESSAPLQNISVLLTERAAAFDRAEGNTYYFSYFVSPYDDITTSSARLKPIRVIASDSAGGIITDSSASLYVDYRVAGDMIGDVIAYSPYWQPGPKAAQLMLSPKVNFFFEATPQQGEANQEVINSFVPLVTKLSRHGVEVVTYGVETLGKGWLSCTDTNSTQLEVSGCEQKAVAGPSVILRYPSFPTTQILVTNTTVEIQPKLGEVSKAVNATIQMLGYAQVVFEPSGNETTGNSTTGNGTNNST